MELWGCRRLARSKKRQSAKSLKTNIKFELYGIIILILSVIALSRQGTVAHSLTYLFRFLLGQWDWLVPLMFIYTAIYIMVRRQWPKLWSTRKTGFALVVCGLVMMSHIGLFSRLYPLGEFDGQLIMQETWITLIEGLSAGAGHSMMADAGGGVLGALLFALLHSLFDTWGAKLIQYTLFGIGFLLLTGLSYVDMAAKLKAAMSEVLGRLGERAREMSEGDGRRKGKAVIRKAAPKKPVFVDDDFEEEMYVATPPSPVKGNGKKRGSLFFDLVKSPKSEPKAALVPDDEEPAVLEEVVLRPSQGNVTLSPPIAAEEDEAELQEAALKLPKASEFEVDDTESMVDEPVEPEITSPALLVPSHNGIPSEVMEQEAELTPRPGSPELLYQLPPFSLLNRPQGGGKGAVSGNEEGRRKLAATLESFGIQATVGPATQGPAVTRYEIYPAPGVKVSRIVSLTDDIALALAAKDIRMEAPIPGKSAIGIEVPNTEISVVTLREVMESSVFHESGSKLTIALGRDISGQPIVANLARMPHLLVAGATGSGKSVCINGIITSVLYKAKPDEVKFLMIDPKMVELNVYNGIPHLLAPVVTDPRRASLALKKVVVEMEKRYELFSKSGTRNMEGYNNLQRQNHQPPLPFIVVIVDELADLMMVAAGDVEDAICRLAQMARAAGIHLIIATQRPSVDVITGVIKANIPSRIAFGVSSQVDSRTILDSVGAEKLLGRGDMLFLPVGASKPLRVQGAFLSDEEVEAVVTYSRKQGQAEYREELVPEIDDSSSDNDMELDELYDQAVQIVVEAKQASVSLLQRRMRVGYTRAARLIDTMEAKGVVGPYEGSKPREVLWSLEQLQHNQNQNRIPS